MANWLRGQVSQSTFMTSDFSRVAAEQLLVHPQSLYHWHHLATAGIEKKDYLVLHHGITGSLLYGMDHPVTLDILIRALNTCEPDSQWHHLIVRTIRSLGRPLLATLEAAGHLSNSSDISLPNDQQLIPSNITIFLQESNLVQAAAILFAYDSALNSSGSESTLMRHAINIVTSCPQFRNNSIHSVPLHVHKVLAGLAGKYNFKLDCKVKVDIDSADSLSLFNQHLKPTLKSISSPDAQIRWITDLINLLDASEPDEYLGAHLIAACACCLGFENPEERINFLLLACDGNIDLYAMSDLVSRFFLRSAPPSLATQLLRNIVNNSNHNKDFDTAFETKSATSIPELLATSENSFYFALLSELSGSAPDCNHTRTVPSLLGIRVSNLNQSRTSYICADRFAVAMFGQARQSAFRTLGENLGFCIEQKGLRFSKCSLSSWSQTAASRYPKNVVELCCLFKHPESTKLARKVATDQTVDFLYSMLAAYHGLSLTNQNLHEALQDLCSPIETLRINALNEENAEADFEAVYQLSTVDGISDIQKKVLLNQYKMWCTINTAIADYIESGCEDPLILHRTDVSLVRILEYIDESRIFTRQNIAIAADVDFEAFVVPPMGGMGDRFWIMTRQVAEVIHSCIGSLRSAPLVNISSNCDTSFKIPCTARINLMEHHRYCDMLARMFAPSFFALPVKRAPIESDALFNITPSEFKDLLIENNVISQ